MRQRNNFFNGCCDTVQVIRPCLFTIISDETSQHCIVSYLTAYRKFDYKGSN